MWPDHLSLRWTRMGPSALLSIPYAARCVDTQFLTSLATSLLLKIICKYCAICPSYIHEGDGYVESWRFGVGLGALMAVTWLAHAGQSGLAQFMSSPLRRCRRRVVPLQWPISDRLTATLNAVKLQRARGERCPVAPMAMCVRWRCAGHTGSMPSRASCRSSAENRRDMALGKKLCSI